MSKTSDRHSNIRYWALRILARSYPHAMDIHVLHASLSDLGYPVSLTDLFSYIAYLEERGCARVTVREEFEDLKMISCLADGLDVIDGRKAIPGISRS